MGSADETKQIGAYFAELSGLSEERFLELYRTPVLLHKVEQVERWAATSFRTMAVHAAAFAQPSGSDRWKDPDVVVLPVTKRPGGAFKNQVSVGRTPQSDICLPYPKLSKFHAYFTWNEDRTVYSVADAGSTNGTFVEARRLAKNEDCPLPPDCLLRFGKYTVRFQMPREFFRLVQLGAGSHWG